jgi:hypothetical protein
MGFFAKIQNMAKGAVIGAGKAFFQGNPNVVGAAGEKAIEKLAESRTANTILQPIWAGICAAAILNSTPANAQK